MNQQELEVLVNHIVNKQDEILVAIKTIRKEPDFSAVIAEVERNRGLLMEHISSTKNYRNKISIRYDEEMQKAIDSQKVMDQLFNRNWQLLEYFKNWDIQKKELKINQIGAWIKRNVAWIAFFSICVTFCFAIYYIEIRKTSPPTYRNLTNQKLNLLDGYLDQNPGILDSLINGSKKVKKVSGVDHK